MIPAVEGLIKNNTRGSYMRKYGKYREDLWGVSANVNMFLGLLATHVVKTSMMVELLN